MTGAERTTATDDTGRFALADVDPNVYEIKITKPGFATTIIPSQVVSVGTQLSLNVTLTPGVVSTTITVTDTPGAELQTMTPTVGTTLSGEIILNLPNTSRDASSLAVLQPGQNINGNVGGVATDQNSFQLDGGYATDDMSGDNNSYVASFASDTAGGIGNYHSSGFNQVPSAVVPVPVASIEEFKISTANQTADFNGGAGSQMQLVTKRGTNVLHGSVYEYYEDSNFAGANTWDNNNTGTAQPSAHFSRFGAEAGGKIPHSNFLGGSWYMFGLYEGFRYPLSSEFEQTFPLPSLRAGIIHLDGQTVNLNPFPVVDPGCGTATRGCLVTAANGYTPGSTIQTTACPSGPCDPRRLGTTINGLPTGTPNPVIALWKTYLPSPNDCTQGDGLNYCGYKAAISTPQSSNFGVARIDHDFASRWHFNATYHYYHSSNTLPNQWDIGGFFPGDTKGQYSAIRQVPQNPWLYTAGLTANLTPSVTNDFHFSFTRNFWAFAGPGSVPNIAGYPAALSVGSGFGGFEPYATCIECSRTRYWNGHDYLYRDDASWLKGNHLFQFGGSYLRNNDTHTRNDDSGAITFEQYNIGGGAPLIGYNINMTPYTPTGIAVGDTVTYQNLYSMILGMVDETAALYTRGVGSRTTGLPLKPRTSCAISGIAATADCIASPSLTDDSIIPTYNLYFSDSWHVRPSFSLNYGLSYTVQMPPYSTNGGYQSVMVDHNDHFLSAEQYLHNVQLAALQGNAYAPLIGFATVHNVAGNPKYPYNPFYGGLSPRVGFAWNFRSDSVIRGGYARIFGRINGDVPVLAPMLTPGLMQPATCGGPGAPSIVGNSTTCGGTTPANVFRVGVDCPASGPCTAPLPPPSAYLPQPWFPGSNDVGTGGGGIDPNFKPNRSDEFTLSIQHQFGPKIMAEAGYIGRILSNELQFYNLSPVPYMMTLGGQTFANAWKNIMVATNYGTNLSRIPAQPFFERALNPEYCAGFANCTIAFVTNNTDMGLMQLSDPFDAWAGVSNAGMFNFGRSLSSDPIAATCSTISPAATTTIGCNGQSPQVVTITSKGFGNYNAGYLQVTFQDWHGLTMKTNLNYSHALGTGNLVQASSAAETIDPFKLQNSYGPQYYDEKFTFNLFLNYAPPFYASQNGWLGRLLGGWNFSPLFVYGTGFPIQMYTATGCSYGACNPAYSSTFENMVITQNLHYSATKKKATGTTCGTIGAGYNVFSNPDATCPANGGILGDPVRNPILGLDGDIGGGGPVRGLPFWNLNLGVTKKIKLNERLSSALYFDFDNVLNHMQAADPCFSSNNLPAWGVLGCGGNLQANTPRRLQLGVSLQW
jgi:hypothetical protein